MIRKDKIKEYIKKQNEVLSKPMKSKKDFENFNKVMSNIYMRPEKIISNNSMMSDNWKYQFLKSNN